jgi:ribosome maturation factor RimP
MAVDLDKVRGAAERVARSLGMEVWDMEWLMGRQRFLRVYLDRPPDADNPRGGVISHEDCKNVSDQLSVILDVEDLVPGPAYTLEVSSPGMDRKLLKPADYERFAGRLAKIWLIEPLNNSKFLEGRLAGCGDGIVRVALPAREVSVPFAAIRKANLVVEF